MKNAVIAIYSRGISSIFTAGIARRIKLISKSMTMIFSIVLVKMDISWLIIQVPALKLNVRIGIK